MLLLWVRYKAPTVRLSHSANSLLIVFRLCLGNLIGTAAAASLALQCHRFATAFKGVHVCHDACSQVRTMAAASSDWLTEDKRLMLHAVYRVGNLEKTEVSMAL